MEANSKRAKWWNCVCVCVNALLLLALLIPNPANAKPPTDPVSEKISATTKSRIQTTFLKAPLHFEVNQGQADEQVKFLARGRGYTMFLTATEAVMVLREASGTGQQAIGKALGKGQRALAGANSALSPQHPSLSSVVRMKLVGANPDSEVVGLDTLPGKVNYFLGNDPKKWRTNIPTYKKVEYEGVYPGINLVFYGNQRQLEYDFVVSPGADPKAIKLAFEGADKLEMEGSDLVITTASGSLRMKKPLVYQEVASVKKEISGEYVLNPKSEIDREVANLKSKIANPKLVTVGFQLASYDTTKPLIIDPVLVYSTYLGGGDNDPGNGIAVDPVGNAYVTGSTKSSNFPVTPGAVQTSHAGDSDAFVTKVDSTGTYLLYSTFLGGGGGDAGMGIAVDSAGNAYMSGNTKSSNFPTNNAFQPSHAGDHDGFMVKLDASGSSLIYSTFLGGSNEDHGFRIAVDLVGNAYVVGRTNSTNFPVKNAFQPAHGGSNDAFVMKIDPSKVGWDSLIYSSFLGRSGHEEGAGIAVDTLGNAHVTGNTGSIDFPTVNAFQTRFAGGGNDAFVTKISSDGSTILYSTYLGGTGNGGNEEKATSISLDFSGNIYVTGFTPSSDFPTSLGALQPIFGGGLNDAFVAKIDPSKVGAASLVYSTYLGGSGNDIGGSVAVCSSGKAYVTGATDSSTDFPIKNAIQPGYGGGPGDAFVAVINPDGTELTDSTYLGGSGQDSGSGIAVDLFGNVYITGEAGSTNFPTTASSFQASYAGGEHDAFVAKIASGGTLVCSSAYITNGGSNNVSMIDVATNTVVATIPVGIEPFGVAVNATGTRVYVTNGSPSNTVSVIDTATNTVVASIGVGDDPEGVAVSPDGSRVYVTNSNSNSVSVINTATNSVIATVGVGQDPVGVDVHPLGTRVYVGGRTVSVIDTLTNNVVASIPVLASGVAVNPAGSRVYVGSSPDSLGVIDTVANTVVATIPVGNSPLGVAVSPDGNRVYVANPGTNTVSVVSAATNTVIATVPMPGAVPGANDNPSGLSLTKDGARLYVTRARVDAVSVIDTSTNNVIATVPVGSSPLALGKFIASAEATTTVGAISAPLAPVQVNTPITASSTFTDPTSSDGHTAVWNWGDGTSSAGNVTATNGSGTVAGSHVYTAAGVYTVTLTVTGSNGCPGQSVFQFIVVYDPNAGFVTGGGWINSPAGAYTADPSLTGKANFGFVSKYQKGANVPTGVTQFQFKVADLNFHSNSYEWLVVGGARAQYKGTGTINGSGSYNFILTAIDGQVAGGGGVDKFRIKIWGSGVIYDNQMGAGDDANPTTALGGGSIVIHTQ